MKEEKQFWSNVYLNDFDWYVQRGLGCGAYLRFVDDFALFSDNKSRLYARKNALLDRLARERLRIHESAALVLPTRCGIPWLWASSSIRRTGCSSAATR